MDLCHNLGSVAIMLAGMLTHLLGINISDFRNLNAKGPKIIPNSASVLLVLSLLGILVKYRPFWPRYLPRLPRFLDFAVDFFFIMCDIHAFLHFVWVPFLEVFSSKWDAHVDFGLFSNMAFYAVRFAISLIAFVAMLHITGLYSPYLASATLLLVGVLHQTGYNEVNITKEVSLL